MRLVQIFNRVCLAIFQSTHPLRDATALLCSNFSGFKFQSTHPLRDATQSVKHYPFTVDISIHAPLTGCDFYFFDDAYVV